MIVLTNLLCKGDNNWRIIKFRSQYTSSLIWYYCNHSSRNSITKQCCAPQHLIHCLYLIFDTSPPPPLPLLRTALLGNFVAIWSIYVPRDATVKDCWRQAPTIRIKQMEQRLPRMERRSRWEEKWLCYINPWTFKCEKIFLALFWNYVPTGKSTSIRVESRHSIRVQGLDRRNKNGQVKHNKSNLSKDAI